MKRPGERDHWIIAGIPAQIGFKETFNHIVDLRFNRKLVKKWLPVCFIPREQTLAGFG